MFVNNYNQDVPSNILLLTNECYNARYYLILVLINVLCVLYDANITESQPCQFQTRYFVNGFLNNEVISMTHNFELAKLLLTNDCLLFWRLID